MTIATIDWESDIRQSARKLLVQTIPAMATLKNVQVPPGTLGELADIALTVMSSLEITALAKRERDGLAAASNAINTVLDQLAVAQISAAVAKLENVTDPQHPHVTAISADIIRRHAPNATTRQQARWPGTLDAIVQHYTTNPPGPLVRVMPDGAVITAYLVDGKLHRDPKQGPAWHHKAAYGEDWQYLVQGEFHRDHRDGPAVHSASSKPGEPVIESYYQHGKLHRPSSEGPATTRTMPDGRVVIEGYYEEGQLHRDPKQGPAYVEVSEQEEQRHYCVRGQLHRDPTDGPALYGKTPDSEVIKYLVEGKPHRDARDGPASRCLDGRTGERIEQYFENGILHRPSRLGPAITVTDKAGRVLSTAYVENGMLHRDPRDGPAHVDTRFEGRDVRNEEYHWQGMWHRPSEDGPAVVEIDSHGDPILEIYVEHGVRHRNPAKGPAWWARQDGCEKFDYVVHGKIHRDAADGPAMFRRDQATGVILREQYKQRDELHRLNGPAFIVRDAAGHVTHEEWHMDGELHRDERDGPAVTERDSETLTVVTEHYFQHGKTHRIGGPARVERDKFSGIIVRQDYQIEGVSHRDDGPSYITRDAVTGDVLTECYYRNGELHRVGGPASLSRNEDGRITLEYWYVNGKPHRDPKDGPAEYSLRATYHDRYETVTDATGETREELVDCRVEWTEASRTEFYFNGERHRELADGPALIERDAAGSIIRDEFWVEGEQIERPLAIAKTPRAAKPVKKRRKRSR
jgi:hypothetical protein